LNVSVAQPEDSDSVSLNEIGMDQLRADYLQLRLQMNELQSYRDQQDKGIALYHLITENIADLLAVIDASGKRIWNNKAYFDTLGYRPEDLTNTDSFNEIHPEDREAVEGVFKTSIQTGVGRKIEYRMRHKAGHWIQLESKSTVVRNERGDVECIVLVARDITDRKRLEEDLSKSQKMQSVATVSEKVADDFNAILTTILGKVNMARQLLRQGTPESKFLGEAVMEGEKAQNVVSQLMSLGTRNIKTVQLVSLQSILPDCLTRSVPAGGYARTEIFMPEKEILVDGSAQILAGAFDHLLRNAAESMDKRGLIRVDLVLERIDKTGALLKPGSYAVLRIRDQGTGIRDEHLSHIFEPYFSTKPGHQGLGLSSALAAISEHQGTVRVYSKQGAGTEAVVYLPAVASDDPTKKLVRNDGKNPNRKRILIMDDERFVREFVIALLDQMGYETVATKNGDELVEEFRASCRIKMPYHAVITDLLVPEGMGGESIPEKLRKFAPDVKIVVTSGFTNHPALLRYREYGFDGALAKPFRAETLKKALDEVFAS
jgi:PAS domain S-box-containing protein